MSHRSRVVNLTLLWITIAASPFFVPQASASTQAPPVVEFSGGYAFLRMPGDNFPRGAFATAGWRATRRIVLVGEIAASVADADHASFRSKSWARTFLAGARVHVSSNGHLEPFVQALAGASQVGTRVWDTSSLEDPLFRFDVRLDTMDVAVQVGGGLTWWMQRRFGALIEAHYQRTFDRFDLGPLFPGHDANEFGLLVGATVGFGRKS